MALLGIGNSQAAVAAEVHITAESERLYREALPDLDKAELMLQTSIQLRHLKIADGVLANDDNVAKRLLIGSVMTLDKAAKLGHPVAHYRLAAVFTKYGSTSEQKLACPLLEASLAQGFAPAASVVSIQCFDFQRDTTFLKMAEAALANDVIYEKYYPIPTTFFTCWFSEETKDNRMPSHILGNRNDYRAEIYYLLGRAQRDFQSENWRAKRSDYYQKAVLKNGCPVAARLIPNTPTPK